MNLHDWITALLGAGVTLGIQAIGAALIALRQYSRQEFSGTIYGILPPSGGKGERIDKLRVRQHNQRIQAKIKRISPKEESGRHWKMMGYTHGNLIVGTFTTTEPRIDPSSYGVIVLHRDPKVRDCGVWRGYYVRPDLHGFEAVTAAETARYPYVWQQLNPSIRNYSHESVTKLAPLREVTGETNPDAPTGS